MLGSADETAYWFTPLEQTTKKKKFTKEKRKMENGEGRAPATRCGGGAEEGSVAQSSRRRVRRVPYETV
jgi:hypothetical protein